MNVLKFSIKHFDKFTKDPSQFYNFYITFYFQIFGKAKILVNFINFAWIYYLTIMYFL